MKNEEKAEELYPDFERDLLYQNRVKKLQRKAFIQGAAWKQEQMIQKACEWLLHNAIGLDDGEFPVYDIDFIEDFKQAMKGE